MSSSTSSCPESFPFYVVAAFSASPFQGNPAAVLFIDDAQVEADVLRKIAVNFNQPMLSVVGARRECDDPTTAAFDICWFTASPTGDGPAVCGHGAMAAARAIFERGIVQESVETIEFRTQTAGTVQARRVGKYGVEIQITGGMLTDLPADAKPKVVAAIFAAFGREVGIKYLGVGSERYGAYLVVELDESEELEKCPVETAALLDTGYQVNVITTPASGDRGLFVSRMFAPATLPAPYSEDAVCGSAHGLLVPYWSLKKGLAVNQPFRATQVSSRGGVLDLFWDGAAVGLKGETFVISKGNVYL